ncbi:MAG: hypothetical protein Tsb0017_05980 [Geothermobacteraceae bacterium]
MRVAIIACLLALSLAVSGCTVSREAVHEAAFKAFQTKDFYVTEFPSRGVVADGLVMASTAAGINPQVEQLKTVLQSLGKKAGDQYLVVTSGNPLLAKSIFATALKDLPDQSLSNVHIGLVGKEAYREDVAKDIERTGADLKILTL